MKALEKERARRYKWASALARDIERPFFEGDPVEAGPPSAIYRLKKLSRAKHRAFLATAAAFAAVLVLATAISVWQAILANRARYEVERALVAENAERREAQHRRGPGRASGRPRDHQFDQGPRGRTESPALSESEARAVLTFFQEKVVAAASPEGQEGGVGREATLRETLDKAEPSVAADFASRPAVEASIRDALGNSYFYLGDSTRHPSTAKGAQLRGADPGNQPRRHTSHHENAG